MSLILIAEYRRRGSATSCGIWGIRVSSSSALAAGHALVAYTVGDPGKAAWSHSKISWLLDVPSWDAAAPWDKPGVQWPDPDNYCVIFDCASGAAKWKSYDRAAQACWSGLNDVAAIVAVGGDNGAIPNSEVVVVTSVDGGRPSAHSPNFSASFESGGAIGFVSVHASLMRARHVKNLTLTEPCQSHSRLTGENAYAGHLRWMANNSSGLMVLVG